jgi:integrase
MKQSWSARRKRLKQGKTDGKSNRNQLSDRRTGHTGKKVRGVFYRRGAWWCRWFEQGRERIEKCDSKSQAQTRYGQHRARIREERFFPKAQSTPAITLRAWLARCLEGSTNRGILNERIYNRRFSLGSLGPKRLTDITSEDVKRLQTVMRLKLKPRNPKAPNHVPPERKWSDGTVNRHMGYLKHCLALAVKDEKITRNPFAGIKFFPEVSTTRFLSEEELIRLQSVMNPKDWPLVALAVETGLRREEQFKLRWEFVDLETGLLTLPLPKGGKSRYVPLSEMAKGVLRGLDSLFRSAWVFPSPKDDTRPMDSRSWIRRHVEPALRRAGIVGVSWHTLRHTCASRRIMAGVDLVSVKEILGHRDIQTTLRYSHLDPRHLQAAINRGSFVGTVAPTVAKEQSREARTVQPRERLVRPAGIEPATLSLEG